MLKNYIVVAVRSLRRQKLHALINIAGLSIGLCCFLIFSGFAVSEFNYDRFHTKAHDIYRLVEWTEGLPNRQVGGEPYGGIPAGPALKDNFAEVTAYARIQRGYEEKFVRANGQIFRSKVSFADPALLQIFTFEWLEGNQRYALANPNSLVLTRERALQLFGKVDVIGERVEIKTGSDFQIFIVGGVIENLPGHSTLNFTMLASLDHFLASTMGRESVHDWYMTVGTETYLLLEKGATLPRDQRQLAAFRAKNFPDEGPAFERQGIRNTNGLPPVTFRLQPLLDIHTNTMIHGGVETRNVWIMLAVAIGILVIAAINFTTLAIGRSANRSREVGVRKVMGCKKHQLIKQFLCESVLLAIASAIIALVLVKLALPLFNKLAAVQLEFSLDYFPQLAWIYAGATLITGVLSGIYPSLVLSRLDPIAVLKQKVRLAGSNFFTRSLVTLQFGVSIILIVGTLVMLMQVQFMRDREIGMAKNNRIMVDADGADAARLYPLFAQKLQGSRSIVDITASEMGVGEGMGIMVTALEYRGEKKGVIKYPVADNFIDVMDMKMIAGRQFDKRIAADSISSIIVNESFLQAFALTAAEAVGLELREVMGPHGRDLKIIGVSQNFHFSPLKERVNAQIFVYRPAESVSKWFLKIQPGDPKLAITEINAAWKAVVPDLPLQYHFVDDLFARFYTAESTQTKVIAASAAVSILLACLGLFGLASLAARNRRQEIGIRKVLGATPAQIVRLVSKEFLALVLVAILIAVPTAWYLMNSWLMEYEYRVPLNGGLLIVVSAMTLLVAFATVAAEAIRSALANPAESMRTE